MTSYFLRIVCTQYFKFVYHIVSASFWEDSGQRKQWSGYKFQIAKVNLPYVFLK